MTKHKHYDSAYRAYYSTSFSPEKRAISECNFFDEINKEFTDLIVDSYYFQVNKLINLFFCLQNFSQI